MQAPKTDKGKSEHALMGEIINTRRGVAIYQTNTSPFWMAWVLDHNTKKYAVRSTKKTARQKARTAAKELTRDRVVGKKVVPKEFTVTDYARRFIEKRHRLVANWTYPHRTRLVAWLYN